MKTPSARSLVATGGALTVAGGILLFQAGATLASSGGVYGFLYWLYPLCLVPGALLVIATVLLYSQHPNPARAGPFAVAGAMASIPFALAGFLVGFVLALVGAFLVLREANRSATSRSASGGTPRSGSTGSRGSWRVRWGTSVGIAAVAVVAILLLCPATIPANVTVVADLANDPIAYDLQAGYVLHDGGNSLSYEVDAVSQSGNCPLGVGYFLNGYTNESGQAYWFQVGLSYDWGGGTFSSSGWGMAYEVFGPTGDSVFPTAYGGAGVAAFSGPINPGDEVVLAMSSVSTGTQGAGVSLSATDQSTQATASEFYSQAGGAPFGGGTAPQFAGFFTGLLIDCYRTTPTGGGLNEVAFSDQGTSQTMAGVLVDELDFSLGRFPYLPAVQLPEEVSGWTTVLAGTSTFQQYGLLLSYSGSAFSVASS
jgi:hypothetical protein